MKRGQVEAWQILLIFELIIVLIIGFYFYQATHQETPSPPTIERELADFALKTTILVQNPHLVTQQSPQQLQRDLS